MSETGLLASLGLVREPFVNRQLPSCCVLTWWGGGEREQALQCLFGVRALTSPRELCPHGFVWS